MSRRTRRATLAALTGTALAGCTALSDSGAPSEGELPDRCPTSRDLEVQWPREIDAESAGEFAAAYEEAYQVREWDPESRFHSVSWSAKVERGPDEHADGFRVTISASGSERDPQMTLQAYEVDPDGVPKSEFHFGEDRLPDDPEHVSVGEVEDQRLRELLTSAATTGHASDHFRSGAEMERYAELVVTLSPDASPIDDSGGREFAYFDVDGTPVLLAIRIVEAGYGDVYGTARYYVTPHVVRRTVSEDTPPESGEVYECRFPE